MNGTRSHPAPGLGEPSYNGTANCSVLWLASLRPDRNGSSIASPGLGEPGYKVARGCLAL